MSGCEGSGAVGPCPREPEVETGQLKSVKPPKGEEVRV